MSGSAELLMTAEFAYNAPVGPMKTVAFVTSKGGVGKTDLLASLAVCATEDGLRVAILDLDPRGDMVAWSELRKGEAPEVVRVDETTFESGLRELRNSGAYDLVMIDTPGEASPRTEAAMRVSDLCLVPTRPNFPDIRAANKTLTLAGRMGRPTTVILNQCLHHPARIEDARKLYTDYGIYCAPAVRQRVDHADAFAAGHGVSEHNAKGSAAEEMRALWVWTRALLWAA